MRKQKENLTFEALRCIINPSDRRGGFDVKTDIIPEPQSIEQKGDFVVFTLTRLAELSCDEKAENAMNYFKEFCLNHFELEFVGTGREQLSFSVVKNLPNEGYRLTVDENAVKIEGGSESGVFYGIQSLIWLLVENEMALSAVEIEDFPQNEYRGLMLDCASWFFAPESIKLFLDVMALHKLNVFHWKLSGDMGWRLELFDNFLLSQIGSARAFTGLGKVPHSGCYSQADVRDILDYAKKRCITVVPELDFPDHTAAAVCAYPSLSCKGNRTAVPTRFGDTSDCLCLGKDETLDFVFSVLDETVQLFESRCIHIGGERSKKSPRSSCPRCVEKMRALGTDESGLLKNFYALVADHLEKRGVKVIVRSSELPADLKTVIFDSRTRPADGALTLDSSVLLSLSHSEMGVRECYEHEPFLPSIGAEAVLNTEHAPSIKKAEELLFPRLGACCENFWTKKESRSFSRFLEKLDSYYTLLDWFGLFYTKKKSAFPGRVKGAIEKIKMKSR